MKRVRLLIAHGGFNWALLAAAPSFSDALGCALCRRILEQTNPNLIQGFFIHIVLLTTVPLVILSVFAFALWRRVRTPRAEK